MSASPAECTPSTTYELLGGISSVLCGIMAKSFLPGCRRWDCRLIAFRRISIQRTGCVVLVVVLDVFW